MGTTEVCHAVTAHYRAAASGPGCDRRVAFRARDDTCVAQSLDDAAVQAQHLVQHFVGVRAQGRGRPDRGTRAAADTHRRTGRVANQGSIIAAIASRSSTRSDSRKKFSRDLPLVPFSDGSR